VVCGDEQYHWVLLAIHQVQRKWNCEVVSFARVEGERVVVCW